MLVAAGDPFVEIDVEGFGLRARISHQLPYYRGSFERYGKNVAALAQLVCYGQTSATMVDVGANIGDTAALARSGAPALPILCIEGDPDFSALLRHNVGGWPDVEIEAPCLLGDVTGTAPGSLKSGDGTAAFSSDAGGDTSVATLDDILESHPRFLSPALIKSDTDGFEARVVAGATRTLDRANPVLFLEYDPRLLSAQGSDGLELLERLRFHGYGPTVVYDNLGDPLCLADLENVRLFDDFHRYASRTTALYFDLAVFPRTRPEEAHELYGRETGRGA